MYCDINDIQLPGGELTEEKLAQLTTLTGETPVEVRQDRLDAIILEKTKLINGYLRGRYRIPADGDPFDDTDGIINTICAKLVIHELFLRKLGSGISDLYKGYKDESLRQLGLIQSGKMVLDTGDEDKNDHVPVFRSVTKNRAIFTDGLIERGFS